jgi:hypothetical protein
MSTPSVVHHDLDACTGSGAAAPGPAGWLAFAATPTFAFMALWTASTGAPPDMLCMQHASPLSGMTAMYALMGAFHVAPWLRLMSTWLRDGRRRDR